ncbi:alpha/beta hydrolase family protein [Streptomyces sp. NPDC090106]|uniref:alpha/beta hydrolase family protein n=1 Tax=Streptomyces sp. NPDC090106 TaxID=3365946 RepID=UPI0037F53B5B
MTTERPEPAAKSEPTVRALWWACRVPGLKEPFDTAHLRVFYPSRPTGSDAERLSGELPADTDGAPYPVVLLLPGINVGQDSYRWLAIELARAGLVAVTADLVGELFAGSHGLTPAIDLDAASPQGWGSRPTTPLIGALLDALRDLDRRSPLAGLLDLDRIALGGHSAGGTVVLQSAAHTPGVRAVFAYAAHTLVATMLGWPEGTVLPVGPGIPVLLLSGEHDGVIASSTDRYAPESGRAPADPVLRTFDEAVPDSGGASAWARLSCANHFTACDPHDPTGGRGFLETPPSGAPSDPTAPRALLGRLVTEFCVSRLRDDPAAGRRLDDLLAPPHPGLAAVRRR